MRWTSYGDATSVWSSVEQSGEGIPVKGGDSVLFNPSAENGSQVLKLESELPWGEEMVAQGPDPQVEKLSKERKASQGE